MKQHEFEIQEDTADSTKWRVWVKVPFLFFWLRWRVVYRESNGIYGDPYFLSKADCMEGIEKWKLENAPDYERYKTTTIKK